MLGERAKLKRCLKIVAAGVATTATLVLIFSLLGLNIQGRVGEINGEFLRSYALSIFSVESANSRLGRDEDRIDWMRQTWNSTVANPLTLVAGQGFGKPLLDDFETESGMQVREPHNAVVGVFGRLGILGVLAWVTVQLALLKRLIRGVRNLRDQRRDLILWLFVFFILALVMAMVQPAWMFSHFAVPVYFIIGFTMKFLEPQAAIQPRPGEFSQFARRPEIPCRRFVRRECK
jgi:O-antigen ligase